MFVSGIYPLSVQRERMFTSGANYNTLSTYQQWTCFVFHITDVDKGAISIGAGMLLLYRKR